MHVMCGLTDATEGAPTLKDQGWLLDRLLLHHRVAAEGVDSLRTSGQIPVFTCKASKF